MARLLGNQGLIMNQANGNAYMRIYSCARTTTGGYIRFTISGGNPPVHIFVKTYFAFVQTNGSYDFPSAVTRFDSMYCDTGGGMYGANGSFWSSGANIGTGWTTSTRQADLYIFDPNNGGWPGRASINCEIYCDRWDYVTLTQLA